MPSPRSLRSLFLLVPLATAAPAVAAPSIASTSPGSLQPGTTTTLVVRGSGLNDATTLWTSFPAEARVDEKRRSGNEVAFEVTVPADVTPGVNAIRVVGPSGVSALKLFLVDDLPSVDRVGGNDSFDEAQPLAVPMAVAGHVDGLKSHFFRFPAKAGQELSFEVFARRLGSPLDPMIRLLGPDGNELEYSDDEPGLTGDCRLRHEFTEDGKYAIELRDITYKGGGGHRFHLRIGDFPLVDVPYPMTAKRGATATIGFAGPAVDNVAPVTLEVSDDLALVGLNVAGRFQGTDGPSGLASIAVSSTDQALEVEPNDDLKSATTVPLGATLHGRLDRPGDEDFFRFTAKKGQVQVVRAVTRSEGSPVDAVLRVLDAGGKQLSNADDTGAEDATITFTPPADGEYVVAIRDLVNRGGPEFAYAIEVAPPSNGFALQLTADHVNVPDTGVGTVTVNATRTGHNGPIEVTAVELPDGFEASKTTIGPGQNSGVLTIRSKGRGTGELLPLKIVGRAAIGGKPFEAVAETTTAIRASHANMPYPPRRFAESSVVSVTPAPPFTLEVVRAPVVFGKQLSGKLKIVAHRREGFDEEIALAVELDKNGVPPNVATAIKPIAKGTNEIEVAFNANQNAPLGRFSTVLRGTLKKGNQTVVQYTPAVELQLTRALAPTVNPAGGTIKKGGELKLEVALGRNPSLGEPIELQFDNLPAGVSLARVGIPTAGDVVMLVLKAAPDAAPSEAKNVTVTGVAAVGKAQLTEKSAPFTIKVE